MAHVPPRPSLDGCRVLWGPGPSCLGVVGTTLPTCRIIHQQVHPASRSPSNLGPIPGCDSPPERLRAYDHPELVTEHSIQGNRYASKQGFGIWWQVRCPQRTSFCNARVLPHVGHASPACRPARDVPHSPQNQVASRAVPCASPIASGAEERCT